MWLNTLKSQKPSIAVWGENGLRVTTIFNSYGRHDLNRISYQDFREMKSQDENLIYSKKHFSIEGNVSCFTQSPDNRYIAIIIDNNVNIIEYNRVITEGAIISSSYESNDYFNIYK